MTKQELFSIIKADGKEKDIVMGALGDLPGCYAYREAERVSENGQETKFYGISYWYKGWITQDIIDRVTITKRAFMEIMRCWPLNLKHIIESFNSIYRCDGGLKSKELKSEEFCPFCREIVRVGWKALESKIDLVYCLAMFLQFSPTYRVWIQDIFELIDKEYFEKHPLTEILRLKRIFIGRLNEEYSMGEFIWRMIFLAVLFNKKLARQLVKELNSEKMKRDEADWYYVLRRKSYNFGGLSIEERLRMAQKLDEKNGNLIELPILPGLSIS